MKKILLSGAALIVLSASASAADLAARANPTYSKAPALSPLTNWSGFYIGAMGGYGWSNDSGVNYKGGFGGGTLGYNWQSGPIVYGLEVDAAGSSIKNSASGLGLTITDTIKAVGSATGRVGFAANSALFYAKGGYAWANNKLEFAAGGVSVSDTKMHSGWTLGGGVEYMFVPNWSAKAEYMYADFASANYFSSVVAGGLDSGRQRIHTVKGGVNYHF